MNDLILIILTIVIGGIVLYFANSRCNDVGGQVMYSGKIYICNK